MLDAGYYVYNWVDLGLRLLRPGPQAPRRRAPRALYRDANMGDDNGFAMYNAVQCTDAAWPGWPAPAHAAGPCTAGRRS